MKNMSGRLTRVYEPKKDICRWRECGEQERYVNRSTAH